LISIRQADVFLSNFLSKDLQSNLLNLKTSVHNTYKCIVIFHFLHTIRVFCRLGSLSKDLLSNLIRSKISDRTIYNKNWPYLFSFFFYAYSFRFSASPYILSAKLKCRSVKICRCQYVRSFF